MVAVGCCVLLITSSAFPIPATLTDDITFRPITSTKYDTNELRVGYGSANNLYAETSYLRFYLPEINSGGDFTFRLGIYLKNAMNKLPTYVGVYIVPDYAPQSPQAMSVYYPSSSGYWRSSKSLAFKQISFTTPGWIYFDWTIPDDSPYYAGLMDQYLSLALSVPYGTRVNGTFYFSSSTGGYSPFLEYTDPPPANPVPEPATLLLLGSGIVGLWFAKRKLIIKHSSKY
jgi:hypothetical protein